MHRFLLRPVLTCALLLPGLASQAQTAKFRRPAVLQLAQMEPYAHVAKLRDAPGGIVVGACQKTVENGQASARLLWVFVPRDRTADVKPLTEAEQQALGIHPLPEAQAVAVDLHPGARYAAGAPYGDVTFIGITTHHAKPRATDLSYCFRATPGQPLDLGPHPHDPTVRRQATQVGLSVPVLRDQARGESAWPHRVEHVPVAP